MMNSTVWVTWPTIAKSFGSLGVFAAILLLVIERENLLSNNLFDVEDEAYYLSEVTCDESTLHARTLNGTCVILDNPMEGSVFTRFGRNVNPESAQSELAADTLMTPNPREVSNLLMGREKFLPAKSVNVIAAAWIQFMTHDWFSHSLDEAADPIRVPVPENDPMFAPGEFIDVTPTAIDAWVNDYQEFDEDAKEKVRVPLARPIPTYQNEVTHWWDGSQIYGTNQSINNAIRSFEGGKLILNSDGFIPVGSDGLPVQGFTDNWWLGLSMLHNLFVKEHNAIADALADAYPRMSDQELYDKARLATSALMAKIHTIEWTPAIINNPVTVRALYANWYGLLGTKGPKDAYQSEFKKWFEIAKSTDNFWQQVFGLSPETQGLADALDNLDFIDQGLNGLVGANKTDNSGVPFTLTEEFVQVYRMHPLMPDDLPMYDYVTGKQDKTIATVDTAFDQGESLFRDNDGNDLWFSFGITNPGALQLKNYPNFLRNLDVPFRGNIDMATIDIVRDRERGIPRYNEFRRQLGLKPITKFEQLFEGADMSDAKNIQLLSDMKRIYNNDVELIDTFVGEMAESVRPEGFAFSETAFQVFIMNASRRLIADRFFTTHYNEATYSKVGLDWVENTSMVDVIKRHYPQLTGKLDGVSNAFQPWPEEKIPENYRALSACEKQDFIWEQRILRTQHALLPEIPETNGLGLLGKIVSGKVNTKSDFVPDADYTKPIHARGVMAKVSFQPTDDSPYTGVFQGSECSLLRLSITGSSKDDNFAPGLAWKVFVDGSHSENVSALYRLTGQGDNHDFFANELSNYVSPEPDDAKSAMSSLVFSIGARTAEPTRIRVDNMAKVLVDGTTVAAINAPSQVFFVPREEVTGLFATEEHDYRIDLMSLAAGTVIYDVYATNRPFPSDLEGGCTRPSNWRICFDGKGEASKRRRSAVKIGELTLESDFVASEFGDSGIFFKHQKSEDK